MASKRGINYQWRLFFSSVSVFWFVIISMAWWQLYRIGDIKRTMVFDQLAMIGERIADTYNDGDEAVAQSFMDFTDEFYDKSQRYDMMSFIIRDPSDHIILTSGDLIPADFNLHDVHQVNGVLSYEHPDGKGKPAKYLYYATTCNDGRQVFVLLPYTKEVARVLSANTTRFWLIFFSIAILVTILLYFAAAYYGRNVRILRDFARDAATNPNFVSPDSYDFPHDEFGDILRQIVSLYNQRSEEMAKSEREHKIALHAIEEKQRIKRDLTGNINHELKTPVGVIQGYIDTIVSDPNMDPATRERFLLKTQANVHRLSELIADISTITRLESGGRLVNVTDVNFHDLVFTFENYLTENNLLGDKMTFSYDIPLDCHVVGNESLLFSVLLNFTKNAVAYSRGTICKVEMYREDDDFYYLRFFDNGIGVPPEHLPHLFERFYRINTGRSRDKGGTGLGLAIAYIAIRSFGGSIEVCNRYPSGLEFDFSLRKYRHGITLTPVKSEE